MGFNAEKDIPDLSGKVVLVTGGNAGIGYHTIKHFALHGAKVYMGSRNEKKAADAIKKLEEEDKVPKGSVLFHPVDISTVRQAKEAAEKFLTKEDRLDILVDNAGLLPAIPFELNEDGVGQLVATNHIGPFVFTLTLLPLLKATAAKKESDVRIVVVSSESYLYAPNKYHIRTLADLNVSSKSESLIAKHDRYAVSKLGNLLFAKELQKKLDAEGVDITVVSLHPGGVWTEKFHETVLQIPIFGAVLVPIMKLATISPDKGSFNTLYAATCPKEEAKSKLRGQYLCNMKQVRKLTGAEWDERARECWAVSEDVMEGRVAK